MIRPEARYDDYAYRVGEDYLADSVTELKEGQWVTYDANGKLVVSNGTTAKSFFVIGSKRDGRDQVGGVPVKKVSFLHGTFAVSTDQFDAQGDYDTAPITALKVTTGGVLTPATLTGATPDSPLAVVAYAKGAPVNGFLKIFSA